MSITVQDVTDDVEYELFKLGIKDPELGRMLRLTGEAENDFAHHTRCLSKSAASGINTTAGTYEYALVGAGTEIIIDVQYVGYGSTEALAAPMDEVSRRALELHPDFYGKSNLDVFCYTAKDTVKLGFNPTSGYKIDYQYSYEPNTALIAPETPLSIQDIYRRALVDYVMWQELTGTDLFDQAER